MPGTRRHKCRTVRLDLGKQRVKDFVRIFYVEFVRDDVVYKAFQNNIVLVFFPKPAEHRRVVVMHMRDKPRRNHRLAAAGILFAQQVV